MCIINLLEKGFVILSFLLFTEAISPILNEAKGLPPDETDPITRALYHVIMAGTILLIIIWHKKVVRVVIKEKLLWAVIGIALVSVLWSAAPVETLRNQLTLIRITLFGVYFATRYDIKEQLQILIWTFGIAAVLSLVFGLVLPSYGVMGMGASTSAEAMAHAGAWRGIYTHKNVMGRIMTLSGLVFLLSAMSTRKYSWLAWIGVGLSVGLIVLSTSKTSLILFGVIIALLPLYTALRWNYTLVLPFFIVLFLVAGGVAILLVSNAEAILGLFGRDLTLTGRTDLWSAVLDKIGERPWLGYGYGGFWNGWAGESAEVWSIVRWQAPHSHNGFLDLGLDLGLLGLLVVALSFMVTCFRAVSWLRLTKTAEALWPLAYLTFLLLANLTESSLFRQKILWLLYVAITLSLTGNREQARGNREQALPIGEPCTF